MELDLFITEWELRALAIEERNEYLKALDELLRSEARDERYAEDRHDYAGMV